MIYEIVVHGRVDIFLLRVKILETKLESNEKTREESYRETKLESNEEIIWNKVTEE